MPVKESANKMEGREAAHLSSFGKRGHLRTRDNDDGSGQGAKKRGVKVRAQVPMSGATRLYPRLCHSGVSLRGRLKYLSSTLVFRYGCPRVEEVQLTRVGATNRARSQSDQFWVCICLDIFFVS